MRSRRFISVGLLLGFASFALAQQQLIVSQSKAKKVAVYAIDETAGSLILQNSVEVTGSPGASCFSRDGKTFYVSLKGSNTIATFQRNDDLQWVLIGEVAVGAGASYLTPHPSGKFLLSSYYVTGKVAVHRIDDEGMLSAEPIQMFATDERAHSVATDLSGKFVFVSHTRPNSIHQFVMDVDSGKLTANATPILQREEKSGPRHLWFHPTGDFAYGSDEQGSSITAYRLARQTGCLSVIETRSCLRKIGAAEKTSTSDIEVHPAGKFAYIAVRGENVISVWSLEGKSGEMSPLQEVATEPVPRSFNISQDGRYLVAAGQSSGKLVLFRIGDDGKLERKSVTDVGGMPWWVQMVPPNVAEGN